MGVEGIILAAGLSSRARTFKMTLEFNGKTVIENTIDNMLNSCKRIILVGGHNIEALRPIAGRYKDVELVYNEDYIQGMYSSVKKGMSCIKEERFFLTPGDYPLILPHVYEVMLNYNAPIIIPVFEGRKGHPVLFQSNIVQQIMTRPDYYTLRDVIRDNEAALVSVNCRGILQDLDTIEDYEHMVKHIGQGVGV